MCTFSGGAHRASLSTRFFLNPLRCLASRAEVLKTASCVTVSAIAPAIAKIEASQDSKGQNDAVEEPSTSRFVKAAPNVQLMLYSSYQELQALLIHYHQRCIIHPVRCLQSRRNLSTAHTHIASYEGGTEQVSPLYLESKIAARHCFSAAIVCTTRVRA